MTPFLLDVNVLVALIDPAHVNHDCAHAWLEASGRNAWATGPLTENAVIRIVGHPRYSNSPGTPAAVAALLTTFFNHPGHAFWPDDISLLDVRLIHADRLLNSSQITDSYLLALARRHGGQLATMDRRLVADAVIEGRASLHLIP